MSGDISQIMWMQNVSQLLFFHFNEGNEKIICIEMHHSI